jgi:mono/diheme cytochrome c family protein
MKQYGSPLSSRGTSGERGKPGCVSRFGSLVVFCALFISWLITALPLLAAGASSDQAGIEFFEKHIRPIFVEHCYKCHSADAEKIKGGFRLDTRAGVLKGGDTAPAIVPGDPEKSLLVKAVRYTNEDLQMPPQKSGGPLTPAQITDLEAWVKMGAPDPRTGAPEAQNPKRGASAHWAFKPVIKPAVPAVKNSKWPQTPVDNFILAKLEDKKLSPNPPADRRTLLRRVTFDLTGLPPSAQEVAAFESDISSDAWAKVVDRLLASPRYGERWGRYWLDIARYADTKGYVFEEERRYPYSYTYRDWVIRALNEDLPYDQFITQQIAADLLPLGEDKRPLAALGFLTLGRRFLNNQADIIDDRIDVVARGTMGLTVTCARCHDHKFDPIPTQDYYSLYGVFASCNEPNDKPLLGTTAMPKQYDEYLAEKKKREDELKDFKASKMAEALKKLRSQVGDYLLAAHEARKSSDDGKIDSAARERKLDPPTTRRWRRRLGETNQETEAIFSAWLGFAALPSTNFAALAKDVSASLSTNPLNAAVARAFPAEAPPDTLKEVAARYSKIFADVDQRWRDLQSRTNGPAATALPEADDEALRQVLYGSNSPISTDYDDLHRQFDTPAQQKVRALKRKVDETDATHPGAPPRAMALVDNATPTKPHVFKRGNANNPGEEVPRQFLEIVAGPQRKPFTHGSGRLEMAQAIVSPENPLTARVFVNRVWMYHFGAPLVRTPSDFGLRSDPPTHPELLDYLAARFMADAWSIKKLHRLILLSSAYQQSSEENSKSVKIDSGNQWVWKMNRRRLDFESMRDTLLAVAGTIDLVAGGRAVDLTTEPFTSRRTVYGFVERQNLPGLFRTFDFASPDTTSPRRFATTVPQQALFLMNSPFVVLQAKQLLERAELNSAGSDEQKVQRLYEAAFQRAPAAAEIKLARVFLQAQTPTSTSAAAAPVWQYGYGRFDEASRRVQQFTPLPYFNGYAWQGGTNLPDPKLGWVILNAEGGHVGNDLNHAAIRRWRAPRDGVIRITAELNHPSDKGDGVRARIVSSRAGELGQWTAQHSQTDTKLDRVEVQSGEFIDFVTDCRASVEFDSFHWSPVIQAHGSEPKSRGEPPVEWNAKTDFGGPTKEKPRTGLSGWEKYAQVLLLANELVFVD